MSWQSAVALTRPRDGRPPCCSSPWSRDRDGDGHAVLTVVTDRGDLVLDNQAADILTWQETGYRFVKRQSQGDPNLWVSLGNTRSPPVVGGGR